MDHHLLPAVGTTVFITLPQPYAPAGGPACYSVADVRGRQLILHSQEGIEGPRPPAGTLCLVGSALASRSSCAAAVASSGHSVLVVDVAPDPRRHPRYPVAGEVRLEAPGTDLGVVAGTLEDLSAGGLRVGTPVRLGPGQRVFVSIEVRGSEPIQALAEVRALRRGEGGGFVVRLQFMFMGPVHQGRLAALLERSGGEPGSAARDGARRSEVLGAPS